MEHGVTLTEMVQKMNLKNLTPNVELVGKEVNIPDVNRPALQLAGFFEHFDSDRVQIIGYVEYTYLQTLTEERKTEIYEKMLKRKVPCVVFSRSLPPEESFLRIAQERDVPVFSTQKKTSSFMSELIRWLNVMLAPCISIHGVLLYV